MRPADDAEVLGELHASGWRARRARAGVAERERTGDRHTKEARHHVGHLDADVGPAELGDPRLLDVDVVVAETERADGVRAQKIGVADDEGVNRVVNRRERVGEHVVRIVVRLRRVPRELVAREHGVPAAHRVIDAADGQVLEIVRPPGEVDAATRVGRLRQARGDVDGRG